MDRGIRYRLVALAVLLALFVVAGLVSLPVLQRCCHDPPLPWPEPPHRSFLDALFFMGMVPRLAALAAAAGALSLAAVAILYAVTAKAEALGDEGRLLGYLTHFRLLTASFVVGVLYLYGFFVTGYFRLGWLNLLWIVGVPVLVAELVGGDEEERRWGGLLLVIPGFFVEMMLMFVLGIGLY